MTLREKAYKLMLQAAVKNKRCSQAEATLRFAKLKKFSKNSDHQ